MLNDTVAMCEVCVNILQLVPKFDWTMKSTNTSYLFFSQVGQGGKEQLTLGHMVCLMDLHFSETVSF